MSEVKKTMSARNSTRSLAISSDYFRNRQSSVITTQIITDNKENFKEVHDIKESINQIMMKLKEFKSYKKKIGDDYFSSIIMESGDSLIGMKFNGEMKSKSIGEFLYGSESTNKNKYLKSNDKETSIYGFLSVYIHDRNNEFFKSDEIQDQEKLQEFINHHIETQNQKCSKILIKKLTETSFIICSSIPICIVSLDVKNQNIKENKKSETLSKFEYSKLPLKYTGYSDDNIFSLHHLSSSQFSIECLSKKFNRQGEQYKSKLFIIETEKLQEISKRLKDNLENFEPNKNQILSCFGQGLVDNETGNYPKILYVDYGDKYLAVCYRYQDSKDVEYFSTFKFEGKKLFKKRFSRILQNKALETNDKTTAMIVMDDKKAIALGTKTGKIIIHDMIFKTRKFIINAHKLCITQLYLTKDKNSIVSISKDKTISKTKLIELGQLKIQKLRGKSYLSIPNKGSTQETSNLILLVPKSVQENNKFVSESFKDILKVVSFDQDKNFKLFHDLKPDSRLTQFGNRIIAQNLSIIELDSNSQILKCGPGKDQMKFNSIELIDSYLVCSDHSKILRIFFINENLEVEEVTQIDFEDESKSIKCTYKDQDTKSVFTHSDDVSALTSHQKFIISGSADGVIKIWYLFKTVSTGLKLILLNELVPPLSHTIQITCLRVMSNEKVFLSSGYDKMIKIWKFKEFLYTSFENRDESSNESQEVEEHGMENKIRDTDKRLIYTISGLEEYAKFIVPIKNDEYFITCSNFGNLNIWSMQTYNPIVHMNMYSKVANLIAVNDNILFSDGKYLVSYLIVINDKNPVELARSDAQNSEQQVLENLLPPPPPPPGQILGPNMVHIYQAFRYFRRCASKKPPEFDPLYDKFVIFPFLLTSQHFYSFFNLPHHLHLSLQNNTNLSESTQKQSPLSIAVSKDYEDCVDSIVKYLKFHLASSPFIINFISDTSLIEMNYSGRDSLEMFYQVLFIKVQKATILRFMSLSVDLPIFKHSPDAVTDYSHLFSSSINEIQEDMGQSVEFMRSAVAISLTMGSKRSVDLLQSFAKCKNDKIFATNFIRAYVDYKMPVVKSLMAVHACIYCFYIFTLIIFLNMTNVSMAVVGCILLCKIILFIFELYKIAAFGSFYFDNYWNVIDFLRMVITNILFILLMYEYVFMFKPSINTYVIVVFFIVAIISYIRSISFFRLIESTQNFTHLLWEIFKDSISFMIFMMYNTVCIAFLFYIASSYKISLIDNFKNSFLLDYGGYNPETGDEPIVWIIYVVAVIINNWMILNFMIAVYSDKFENVKNLSMIQSYRTKVEMAYEVEVLMTWNRENMVAENTEYYSARNEEGRGLEYQVIRPGVWFNRFLKWLQKCFGKENEDWVIGEPKSSQKPIKEYLHMCKSIVDDQEIDLDLERVNSMWFQVKKSQNKTRELASKVLKIQDDSEKNLKFIKSVLHEKRSLDSKKEEGGKDDADERKVVKDDAKKRKDEIRKDSGSILMNMISIALSKNLIEKKRYKKNIAICIDRLLNPR